MPLIFADFWKKVRVFPPLGHPPGGKTALFSGIRRLRSLGARDLPKIVYFRGGGPKAPRGWSPRRRVGVSKTEVFGPVKLWGTYYRGLYRAPPLKTRSWEGTSHLDHVVAESRKKVRFFPLADGPAGGKPALFFRFRRLHGLSGWYLTEKLVKTGGTPFLSAF